MPCDNLAVARARLTPEVAAELLANAATLDALRGALAAHLGVETTLRTQPTRQHGRAETYEAAWITAANGVQVVVASNRVTIQGPSQYRAVVETARTYVEGLAGQLATLTARERVIARLKERYAVQADARTATGTRVLRLSI